MVDKVRIFLNKYLFKFLWFRVARFSRPDGKLTAVGLMFPVPWNFEKNIPVKRMPPILWLGVR